MKNIILRIIITLLMTILVGSILFGLSWFFITDTMPKWTILLMLWGAILPIPPLAICIEQLD